MMPSPTAGRRFLAALLGGIAAEIVFARVLVYTPFLPPVFGTAALSASQLMLVAPFPFVVWGADDMRRMWRRRRCEC